MEFQGKSESFSKLCHTEGHLRHAIVDFTSKRLFCGSGAVVACKPLKFEEMDYRYKQGLAMIPSETIDISKGANTTLLNANKISIEPLGVFDYAKPEQNPDMEDYPIPNPAKIVDAFNDRRPMITLKFKKKNLKNVLDAIGHDFVAINIFAHTKYEDKIDSAVVIDNLYTTDLCSKAIVMQMQDEGQYEWKGFENTAETFEANLTPVSGPGVQGSLLDDNGK